MAQGVGALCSTGWGVGARPVGVDPPMAGLPGMRLAVLAGPSITAPSPLAALVGGSTLRFCRTAAPCNGGGSWGGRQGLWGRGWGGWKCVGACGLKTDFRCISRAYSDSPHRQLSNGTRRSSSLHRTRELWGNQVWAYCMVLPAPPPSGAFFPFPPVLPHACRTAVRHVHAGDQRLTVLASNGLHGLWQGLGLRAPPCRVGSAPMAAPPALHCSWLHGPLAPALSPWRGHFCGEGEVCVCNSDISMHGPALAGCEGHRLVHGAAATYQQCRTFLHPLHRSEK